MAMTAMLFQLWHLCWNRFGTCGNDSRWWFDVGILQKSIRRYSNLNCIGMDLQHWAFCRVEQLLVSSIHHVYGSILLCGKMHEIIYPKSTLLPSHFLHLNAEPLRPLMIHSISFCCISKPWKNWDESLPIVVLNPTCCHLPNWKTR